MRKKIDTEDHIPFTSNKRRKKKYRKIILIILFFLVLLLILLYFQSKTSKIDGIKISRTVLNDQEYYLQQADITPGHSLWGFSPKKSTKRLEAIKVVRKASVSRKWFRDVQVSIKEWSPIAWIDVKGRLSLILENGEIHTPDVQFSANIPIVTNFEEIEFRKLLISQLVELDDSVYQLISEIRGPQETDSDKVILFMDDGYEVHASLSTLADKMSYYPEIVNQLSESEKGVIDIEVGTYFTPYSQFYKNVEKGDDHDSKEKETEKAK